MTPARRSARVAMAVTPDPPRGARQICGALSHAASGVSSFPEAFEAAPEDAAAQGEDGIGAGDGPVHSGALEARSDGMFATRFDDAGGDAQAAGPERGIAHALTVADEIVDAFAGLVAGWGVVGKGGDDGADAAGIEFVTSLFCPLRGEVGPGCVDGLGDVPEVAFGVEDVRCPDPVDGLTLAGSHHDTSSDERRSVSVIDDDDRCGSVGISRPGHRRDRRRSPARFPTDWGRPPRRPSDSARC